MLVYRLQESGSNHCGAYSVWVDSEFPIEVSSTRDAGGILTDDAYGDLHPDPERDELLSKPWGELGTKSYDYFFGCASPEQFIKWFFRTDLYELVDEHSDAVIAVYEVPDEFVLVSQVQAVFDMNQAKKVMCLSLTEFKQLHVGPTSE